MPRPRIDDVRHKGKEFAYMACITTAGPCICKELASSDPSSTIPANRALIERNFGELPPDEVIDENYLRRYGP